jgi:acetyl-CoA carboxylase biotin carboxyl carrier protein
MGLSDEDVQEIVALLDDLHATELHLRTRHFALSLRRDGVDGQWAQASTVRGGAHVPAPAAKPPAEQTDDGSLAAVRTPLMGTFYRAPKPGADPFVEVGSTVESETVVGIVETMKLMNSVHAGVPGRVAEICLGNAEYAEQGAVLMRIAPLAPEDG